MCKLGDIIIIDKSVGDNGNTIGKHSFIVIDDKGGIIQSLKLDTIVNLKFDIVANVISSFKSKIQRNKKLKYKEKF